MFQDTDGLINRLFAWAEKGAEPLQSYATGLLASAMELQDLAANFREQNAHLAPVMLKRLWEIQKRCSEGRDDVASNFPVGPRRFAKISDLPGTSKVVSSSTPNVKGAKPSSSLKKKSGSFDEDAELMPGPEDPPPQSASNDKGKIPKSSGKSSKKLPNRVKPPKERKTGNSSLNASVLNDSSNSSWAEMESYVIGILFVLNFSSLLYIRLFMKISF